MSHSDKESMEAIFKEWWSQSYPFMPGTHAIMTHTAFAAYVLTLKDAPDRMP